MDRRSLLTSFLGRNASYTTAAFHPLIIQSGLEPYQGAWTKQQAAHLLRRATFGATPDLIQESVGLGLEASVTKLLEKKPLPAGPLNYESDDDPLVPIGSTWIHKDYPEDATLKTSIRNKRRKSLSAWAVELILTEGFHAREKMTLFWHNHFVTSNTNEPLGEYDYITRLRRSAFGNFRSLVKEMTTDYAMLIYLNGNRNTKWAPNENYARELLELFSIGKGPIAGPGDYTNYTEEDIQAAAKVLTGWYTVVRPSDNDPARIETKGAFKLNRHDTSEKQFSHRFDNRVIGNMGDQEYEELIDMIFENSECARFISRKLYRWFVFYKITPEVEVNVIEPMAQIILNHDYEIEPALAALFKSQHFHDMQYVGPMIKNPIEFITGTFKLFNYELPADVVKRYKFTFSLIRSWRDGRTRRMFEEMQMEYFEPPSVAGWKAYYQEPSFYRIWINSATLAVRMYFTNHVASGVNFRNRPHDWALDILSFVNGLSDAGDPNKLIEEIAEILYPQPISENQKIAFKDILILGLPDFEWTVEYGQYRSDPDNEDLKNAVEAKLRNLIQAMLAAPEYYLS